MYVFVYELVRKPVIHKVFLANHTQKVGKKHVFTLFLSRVHARTHGEFKSNIKDSLMHKMA